MSFDLRNSGIRILIRPHRIDCLPSSSGNAVVTTLAFIRTVGSVLGPFQLRKICVLTWNVLNGRIVRFPKRQGVARIGNHPACDRYYDASGISLDGNRMIWTWKLDLLFFHVSVSLSARVQPFRNCVTCSTIVASSPTEPVSRCPLRARPQLSETSLITISTAVGP